MPTPNGDAQLTAAFPSSPIGLIESTIGPNAVKSGNPTFTNIQNVLVTNQIDPTTGFAFPCVTQGVNGCTPVEFGSLTRFVPGPFNDYEATGRLDFKLSEKDNFFGRYVYQKTDSGGVNFGNGIQVGDWQQIPGLSQQIGLDWVRNFSNAFVNQVRFSYSRASSFFDEQSFSGCNSTNPTNCPADMVLIGSAPQDSVSFGVSAGFPQGRIINVYQLQDNASMLKGQHSLKFGGEIDQQRSPNVFLPGNNGIFLFTSYSDMIANNPFGTQIALGSPTLPFSEWDLGFYVQDDWRIKSNLTLNLGMRWDWYQQAINLLHDQSVKQQTGSESALDDLFATESDDGAERSASIEELCSGHRLRMDPSHPEWVAGPGQDRDSGRLPNRVRSGVLQHVPERCHGSPKGEFCNSRSDCRRCADRLAG